MLHQAPVDTKKSVGGITDIMIGEKQCVWWKKKAGIGCCSCRSLVWVAPIDRSYRPLLQRL